MIKLGLLLTIFITAPILWCLYYIYKGFMEGHRQHKDNGGFKKKD